MKCSMPDGSASTARGSTTVSAKPTTADPSASSSVTARTTPRCATASTASAHPEHGGGDGREPPRLRFVFGLLGADVVGMRGWTRVSPARSVVVLGVDRRWVRPELVGELRWRRRRRFSFVVVVVVVVGVVGFAAHWPTSYLKDRPGEVSALRVARDGEAPTSPGGGVLQRWRLRRAGVVA